MKVDTAGRRAGGLTVLERYLRQLQVTKRGVHAGGVEQQHVALLGRGALQAGQGGQRGEGDQGAGSSQPASKAAGCRRGKYSNNAHSHLLQGLLPQAQGAHAVPSLILGLAAGQQLLRLHTAKGVVW